MPVRWVSGFVQIDSPQPAEKLVIDGATDE